MKTLVTLVALLAAIAAANAFGSLEVETSSSDTETFRFFQIKPITNTVGIFSFAVVTEGWGQAYAGLDYSPSKNFDFGLGYGVDTAGNNRRIGGYAILNEGRFSLKHFFESEGSGEFHKTFLTYQFSPKITLGACDNKFLGTGPLIDYTVSKGLTARVVAFPHETTFSLITTF